MRCSRYCRVARSGCRAHGTGIARGPSRGDPRGVGRATPAGRRGGFGASHHASDQNKNSYRKSPSVGVISPSQRAVSGRTPSPAILLPRGQPLVKRAIWAWRDLARRERPALDWAKRPLDLDDGTHGIVAPTNAGDGVRPKCGLRPLMTPAGRWCPGGSSRVRAPTGARVFVSGPKGAPMADLAPSAHRGALSLRQYSALECRSGGE
jgi:hypothetical protein